jgi:hypothetical protein
MVPHSSKAIGIAVYRVAAVDAGPEDRWELLIETKGDDSVRGVGSVFLGKEDLDSLE